MSNLVGNPGDQFACVVAHIMYNEKAKMHVSLLWNSLLNSNFLLFQERQPPSQRMPVYYPAPNVSRPASQLTEEEQIKIAKRLGLISHLPTGVYDGSAKKSKE